MEASRAQTRLLVAEGNLRGYRGLTLDAFGALLDGGPTQVPPSLTRIVHQHRPSFDARALTDVWHDSLQKQCRTEPFLSFREAHRRAFRGVFEQLRVPGSADECVDDAFEAYHRAKVHPEVPSVLRGLEPEVPVAVVSNMDTRLLLEALQNNGLHFTFVITSEEEQRYKPSPSLFRRAIRYLGLPAAHILHVGDSYAEDVVGASAVGMAAARIDRSGGSHDEHEKDHPVVRNLEEVRALVHQSWT